MLLEPGLGHLSPEFSAAGRQTMGLFLGIVAGQPEGSADICSWGSLRWRHHVMAVTELLCATLRLATATVNTYLRHSWQWQQPGHAGCLRSWMGESPASPRSAPARRVTGCCPAVWALPPPALRALACFVCSHDRSCSWARDAAMLAVTLWLRPATIREVVSRDLRDVVTR